MRLTYSKIWIIAICILLFISFTALFFLYKVSGSDKTSYIKDHIDSLFINKYNPINNPISVKPSQQAENIPVADNIDSIRTVDKSDAKVETPVKSADLMNVPKEKKKPVQSNRRYEDYGYDQEVSRDQNYNYDDRGAGDYSLSTDEIRAILAGYDREDNSDNNAGNLSQAQRSTTGPRALNDYVRKNRRSLSDPDCANQHGKVILLFKVDQGGHPVDVTVFRSLCQAADREAVRLLVNGPVWPSNGDNFNRWEVTF